MWTRRELKARAKSVLKGSYWKALLVSFILSIVGADNLGSFNMGRQGRSTKDMVNESYGGTFSFHDEYFLQFLLIFLAIFILIMLVVIAFRVFLGYPLEVGGRRYFVRSAEGEVNMNYLGYSFSKERYMSIVKGMLYRGVLIFLWSLLLIIPGIIKAYAYRMVPYLLANNPQLDHKRAIEISKQMTDGEKWAMFVLDLSFIGWYILGALALGIGIFFVMPYVNATFGELYLKLRQKALDTGISTYEELNLPGSNEI